jgi:SAM-dependent methyltransferase
VGRNGPPNVYDAVVMAHVIEHVPDPTALVAEAHRVLQPGGRLVSVTPNARSAGHRAFGRAWRGLEPPRHLHVFTPESLRTVAVRGGFPEPGLRSSARIAAYLSAQSRKFAQGGSGPDDGPTEAVDRAFQKAERRALSTDPWAGEELILIARKGA